MERGGSELLKIALYDAEFMEDLFPSISHSRSTMGLLVAGDIDGPYTAVDSGSLPMVVHDSGSGTNIHVIVRKNG